MILGKMLFIIYKFNSTRFPPSTDGENADRQKGKKNNPVFFSHTLTKSESMTRQICFSLAP